jgi:hypothetical protein
MFRGTSRLATRVVLPLLVAFSLSGVAFLSTAGAQPTITPASITASGAVCTGGSENVPVSITLPPSAVLDEVDVALLFDDTGSFAGFVPSVAAIFSGLVTDLEAALPGVEFGFGVGRFEDYGGPGNVFSGDTTSARPFTLNQPIVTAATAGGAAARNTLISDALARSAPGGGGDGPESGLEGLFQAATGAGFDGDGNGVTSDSGAAGAVATQTTPGTSGDVPAFSSNVAPTSGSLGGFGFRPGALHLTILATDIVSIAANPSGAAIPATITGTGGSEPIGALAGSATPGSGRFGFVSDAKGSGGTVASAVAPLGAATVQGTVNALNALGIRVLGMGPGAAPTSSTTPATSPSTWLSAIARLTGATDSADQPLVFSTSVPPATLSDAIVDAISTTATEPVDIGLATSTLPAGLTFGSTPPTVDDVGPGGTASFATTLTGDGTAINGTFTIDFVDVGSGAVLGSLPVTVSCTDTPVPVKERIKLEPKKQKNLVGTPHTVTATVKSKGAPVPDRTVTFKVVRGPNAGLSGAATTNAAGVATFTYTSTKVGTDEIRASFVNAAGKKVVSKTVSKEWSKPRKSLLTGGGWVKHTKITADLASWSTTAKGDLRVHGKHSLEAKTITSLDVERGVAVAKGTAKVNRKAGYTFGLTVTDGRPDTVRLVVRNAGGATVWVVNGPVWGNFKLTDGD